MKFSFRPTAFAAVQTWELDSNILTTAEQQALELSQVSNLWFNDGSFRGCFFTFFDLTVGETTVTVNCEDYSQGQNRKVCFELINEIIEQLKACSPSLKVQIGPSETTKQIEKSVVYLFILLISAFFIPLLVNSLESSDYIDAFLIILVFVIISIFLIQVTKSSKAPQSLPLADFQDWLSP